MWARLTNVCAAVLALLIVGAAGGCTMVRRYSPDDAPLAVRRSLDPADDLRKAVTLIADLRYRDAEFRLVGLSEQLRAKGDGDRAAEALFWHAYCREKRGQTDQAADLYTRVTQTHAQSPASRNAAARLRLLQADAPKTSE